MKKIRSSHLTRTAWVYLRQSSPSQVENNRESTDRQYKLKELALSLGWSSTQVTTIDEDLARSGSGLVDRSGFDRLASSVALGSVGIILSIEVSRLARNNAEWYRLLDFCSVTDTLIGDTDGLYHPGLFNDRLLLGLKGTMSEAELYILRARLDGGIRNKAQRGELRRGLPVGFVWGEADGEVLLHPDEAVRNAIKNVFDRFEETGSVRRVWLWFRSENLLFPNRAYSNAPIRWIVPTYISIHQCDRDVNASLLSFRAFAVILSSPVVTAGFLPSLYKGPFSPFGWSPCFPCSGPWLLTASPCNRLSLSPSTISQSDSR